MDPEETYKEIMRLTRSILGEEATSKDDADALATAVFNLDMWLRHGGFYPKKWSDKR